MRYPGILSLAVLLALLSGAAFVVWRSSTTVGGGPAQQTGPQSPATTERGIVPREAKPTSVAIHAGEIYWTEFAAGHIRAANLDGSGERTVVAGLDRPVGIAVGTRDDRLYWTTDGAYPRKVQSAQLDGSDIQNVIGGAEVNRPSAIAVDNTSGEIYWSESVAGRIRRKSDDDVTDTVDSGVSSLGDRPGDQVTWALGIALDPAAEKLYWSELTSGTIQRVNLDGTGAETIVPAGDPCNSPAGVALNPSAGRIYWTDLGCGAIFTANLDGTKAEAIVTQKDGLIGPRGIAIDPTGRNLYWTDVVTEKIQRAGLDGSKIEDVVRTQPTDFGSGENECARAIEVAGRMYARRKAHAMSLCLEKVGAVKAVKRGEADAAKVAQACIAGLYASSEENGSSDTALRAALETSCPDLPPDAVSAVCTKPSATAGGDWINCVGAAYTEVAWNAVVTGIPRTLEWIEELRPFVQALESGSADQGRVAATLGILDDLYATVGERSPVASAPSGGFPASGQMSTYPIADQEVPDDGTLRAGSPMRFRDNLDGTINDLNTGLTWEKKCDCPDNPHDYRRRLPWSGNGSGQTIWDWLAQVNSEGSSGFGGHSDWRIPNPKELISIIDYERFNPAVGVAFDGPLCGLGCTDLRDPSCSCTTMKGYWSSTSFADDAENALVVGAHLGLLGDMAKREDNAVRAVRGGIAAAAANTR